MNIESGYFLALVLVGFVLLVVALVAIFYKPGKRLNVNYNFKSDKDKLNKSIIEVFVENIGKKRVKMLFPYVKFSSTSSSKLFQLNSERVNCRFPKIIKKGEKLNFEIDISQYINILKKQSFEPTHVRVVIEDTVGLKFKSHNLDFD